MARINNVLNTAVNAKNYPGTRTKAICSNRYVYFA